MHVRPVREVPRSAEVGVAERLDVRDLRRAEPCLLRGRETKEELRSVRNELGPRDACGESHLLRKAGTTVEASSDEPLANARDLEETAQLVEDRRCTVGDVVERVAAEQDGDVVRLENHGVGVGREADRVLEHAHLLPSRCRRAAIDREVPRGLTLDIAIEVGQPPGHRDSEPRRRLVVAPGESGQRLFERLASITESGGSLVDPKRRGDHLVMQRGHENFHVVVHHHTNAAEEVLLRRSEARPTRAPARSRACWRARRSRPRRAPMLRRRRPVASASGASQVLG